MPRPIIDPAAAPDFDAMTIDELRLEALRLADVVDLAHDQRTRIFDLIDRRQARARAENRVRDLSAVDRDALRSVLAGGP